MKLKPPARLRPRLVDQILIDPLLRLPDIAKELEFEVVLSTSTFAFSQSGFFLTMAGGKKFLWTLGGR